MDWSQSIIYRKQIGRGDNVETIGDEDGLVTIDNLLVVSKLKKPLQICGKRSFW